MNLKNKVVVVTGASAGIGEATARALAEKGAKVVLVARSAEKLAALEKELGGSVAMVTDMSEPAEVKKMIAAVHKKMGGIDVLVNNAGQGLYGPVEHVNLEDYEKVWALNVVGPLAAMEAVIPIMRAQESINGDHDGVKTRGIILNVSSMVSKNYFPYLGAYASTKYALNALSLTARTEVAKDGIVICVVHPGLTATDFGKNSIRTGGMEGMVSRQRENMPAADSAELVAGKIVETIEAGTDAPAETMWK